MINISRVGRILRQTTVTSVNRKHDNNRPEQPDVPKKPEPNDRFVVGFTIGTSARIR